MVVDATADVDYAAYKCVSAKYQNAGQTCLTVDYVVCHESKFKDFVSRIKWHIKDQFGVDPDNAESMKYNPDVGKIVASFHLDRIESILKEVEKDPKCETIVGGSKHLYKKDLYLTPTVYANPPLDSTMMIEENFAPILPIVPFVDFDEVLNKHIHQRGKPLAIYYFGSQSGPGSNY